MEDQWYDMWLNNPRDLGANGTHCKSHCLSSYDTDSLNNIAGTAVNKVYGKNRDRFPWAQRGRRWDYVDAQAWKNLRVHLGDGSVVTVSSAPISIEDRKSIDFGTTKVVAVRITRDNGSMVDILVTVTKGHDQELIPTEKSIEESLRDIDALLLKEEGVVMSPDYNIKLNARYLDHWPLEWKAILLGANAHRACHSIYGGGGTRCYR